MLYKFRIGIATYKAKTATPPANAPHYTYSAIV